MVLQLYTPKRTLNLTDQELPLTKKRRHGIRRENLHIDKEQLLEEARLWGALEKVNWSELGTKYGVKGVNRGENIKEFLAGYETEATKQQQRKYRALRRAKKRVQGIKYPGRNVLHGLALTCNNIHPVSCKIWKPFLQSNNNILHFQARICVSAREMAT